MNKRDCFTCRYFDPNSSCYPRSMECDNYNLWVEIPEKYCHIYVSRNKQGEYVVEVYNDKEEEINHCILIKEFKSKGKCAKKVKNTVLEYFKWAEKK